MFTRLPKAPTPFVQSATQGSLFTLHLDALNCPVDPLSVGSWFSYSMPHLVDINVF